MIHDDDIDLRPYLRALIARWWLIVLFTIVLAVAGFIYSKAQPDLYQATASIILTRTRSNLNMTSQFQTDYYSPDDTTRMKSLVTIASDKSIALDVANLLNNSNPARPYTIDEIFEFVTVGSNGDVMQVTATTEDPEMSSKIANLWATQVEKVINQAYNDESPTDYDTELQDAQKNYETAQANLENFIQNNQLDQLNQQINDAQTLFNQLAGERARQILYLGERKQNMEVLVLQAETLKKQIQNQSQSNAGKLGDTIAVLNARATALGILSKTSSQVPYSINSGTVQNNNTNNILMPSNAQPINPYSLQITNTTQLNESSALLISDIDTIIQLAKSELNNLDASINQLVQDVNQGKQSDQVLQTAATLHNLQKQLEEQSNQKKDLTKVRDQAYDTYQVIIQKNLETTSNPKVKAVNMAGLAITPTEPMKSSTIKNSSLAGAAGLVLGVLLILGTEWWRTAKVLEPTEEKHSPNVQPGSAD